MTRFKLLLMLLLFANVTLFAQQNSNVNAETSKSSKFSSFISNFSVTATAASPSINFKEMNNPTLKKATGISMGELNIAYKLNPRISFGVSTMGSLGLCNSGYYNKEGAFVPFSYDDDDDDDDGDNDDNEPDDDDDDNETEDDDNDDGCGEFGNNVMGTFTYKFSEKIPFFVQAAGGYSFDSNAPAFSAMIGYNQRIFKGLGIIGGIRYSDVLYKKPDEASSMAPSSGIRAELGLNLNF